MALHDGHRERLRGMFLENGLDGMTDIQALELLLTYAIARKDVNPLAHDLLNRFGSLPGVLDADPAELQKVPGVGEHTAALIALLPQLMRRYGIRKNETGAILKTTEEIGRYLMPYFFGATEEKVCLLCLDAKCKVLDCRVLFTGSVNAVAVNVRRIMEEALRHNATTAVLAHNHVAGVALPSREDQETTRQVLAALDTIGVYLTDHLIFAGNDYVSLADSGFFNRF